MIIDTINTSFSLLLLSPLIALFLMVWINEVFFIRIIVSLMSVFIVLFTSFVFKLQQKWGALYFVWTDFFGNEISMLIDGMSIAFLMLLALVMPICYIAIQSVTIREKEYTIALVLLHFFMTCVFLVQNILLFYIFFEAVLISMYFIIGAIGSRERRVYAAYQLLLYTIFGSIPFLFGLLGLYLAKGTFDISILSSDTDYGYLGTLIWLSFFIGFAVKVPMVPFHIWLPEAHVEAPTAGSVVLAAILLKFGSYGFIRFLLPMFPLESYFFGPYVVLLSSISVIYVTLTTIRQVDLKKIVAYSSVGHMGVVTAGIFSFNEKALQAAIFIMFSHAFVSGALFLCIGIIYDRYKTRNYKYFSGLVQSMPIFTLIFLFFTMANLGLPGTAGFVGEFFVFMGSVYEDFYLGFIVAFGAVLSACYALWAFNRFSFSVRKLSYLYFLSDINFREFLTVTPLVWLTLLLGVYPQYLVSLITVAEYIA